MRKIRWEGFVFLMLCVVGLFMTMNEKYMLRLAESTDQLFWIIILSYFSIEAVKYIFPKEKEYE